MIVYTNDQHYSDIADAIREKTGDTEAEYLPSEMAEAIENIPSGGGESLFVPFVEFVLSIFTATATYNGGEI